MLRIRLVPVLSLMLLSSLACLLPPASVGFRGSGDVAPKGSPTVGAGASATNMAAGTTADVELAVSDQVAVGGSVGLAMPYDTVGLFGPFGLPTRQAQVRWATEGSDDVGFSVTVGAAGIGRFFESGDEAGFLSISPVLGGTVRHPTRKDALAYYGLHLQPAGWTSNPLFITPHWITPVAGLESAPGPVRWGGELMVPMGVVSAQAFADATDGLLEAGDQRNYLKVGVGAQVYLRLTGTGRRDQ